MLVKATHTAKTCRSLMKKIILILMMIVVIGLTINYAHGSNITYKRMNTYALHGSFDDGTAMSDAQIIIFSPTNPETPWLTTSADADGNYLFVPDEDLTGEWTIQFRSAGHGDMISINTEESIVSQSSTMNFSQKLLVGLAILWGFIGTSLYFRKKAN